MLFVVRYGKMINKVFVLLLMLLLFFCYYVRSADSSAGSGSSFEGVTVDVWPEGFLGEAGVSRGVEMASEDDNIVQVTDVSIASMTFYKAGGKEGARSAVLVCPGGGYSVLAMDLEGTEIAEWLNSQGITAVVLKYRVPNNREGGFADGQRAMSILRYRAKEFGIDPERIGVIGFSAGGHLCARLYTGFSKMSYGAIDEIDEVSCRPDFAMLIYPYSLTDRDEKTDELKLAKEFVVTKDTPATILIHAQDDPITVENSILYFLALKKADVPSELHVFATGGHGYGLRPSEHAVSGWPGLCNRWLRGIGAFN